MQNIIVLSQQSQSLNCVPASVQKSKSHLKQVRVRYSYFPSKSKNLRTTGAEVSSTGHTRVWVRSPRLCATPPSQLYRMQPRQQPLTGWSPMPAPLWGWGLRWPCPHSSSGHCLSRNSGSGSSPSWTCCSGRLLLSKCKWQYACPQGSATQFCRDSTKIYCPSWPPSSAPEECSRGIWEQSLQCEAAKSPSFEVNLLPRSLYSEPVMVGPVRNAFEVILPLFWTIDPGFLYRWPTSFSWE